MTEQKSTLTALRSFYARLETLRNMQDADMVFPGKQNDYQKTLEDAYTLFARLETELDALSQELESHHHRLGEAVERYKQK